MEVDAAPVVLLALAVAPPAPAAAAEPGGFSCVAPLYASELAQAAASAASLSPDQARAALSRLRSSEGDYSAHLGFAALYAVRAQGAVPASAVYCDQPASAQEPLGDRWIGVAADGGRRFRLDLNDPDQHGVVEMSRLEELPPLALLTAGLNAAPPADRGDAAWAEWVEFKRALEGLAGRPYVYGGTDCAWLPHTALNSVPGLCSRRRSYFDHDGSCFVRCDGGPYQPGDLILLGRAAPDHWIVLSEVNDTGRANSPANKAIDQSSDCRGHCGERPVRPNLAERKVYACARPRGLVGMDPALARGPQRRAVDGALTERAGVSARELSARLASAP